MYVVLKNLWRWKLLFQSSIFALSLLLWSMLWGDEDHHVELRVQTIIELDQHIYLADGDLADGDRWRPRWRPNYY